MADVGLLKKFSKKMSICLHTSTLAAGGAERQVVILATALSNIGIKVSVICKNINGENGHYVPLLNAYGIDLYVLDRHDLAHGASILKKNNLYTAILKEFFLPRVYFVSLLGSVSSLSPDILHCYLDGPNCMGGCVGLVASIPGILLSCRSLDPASAGYAHAEWALPVYKFLQKHKNIKMEANSLQGVCSYANWLDIPVTEISVNYNGIPHELYSNYDPGLRVSTRRKLGINENSFFILCITRDIEYKCPEVLLEIASELRKNGADFVLGAVGTGLEINGRFGALIQDRGLCGKVHLLGVRDDVVELLSAADVLLLTSRVEGLPNAVMEAMCAGLPIVATNVGGVSELVRNGKEGFLHPIGDVDGMAKSLMQIYINKTLKENMGNNAKKRIVKNFTVSKLLDRTIKQYVALLKNKTQYIVYDEGYRVRG